MTTAPTRDRERPTYTEAADDGGMTLARFVSENQGTIAPKIIETYRPRYNPSQDHRKMPALLRRPLGMQEKVIRATAQSMAENRGTNIVGEMGSGKTFLAIGASKMAGFKKIVVICPPHLVRKWYREVKQTLPKQDADVEIVRSVTDMQRLDRNYRDSKKPLYVIMSRETAKLSHSWSPAPSVTLPLARGRILDRDHGGRWAPRYRNGQTAQEMRENLERLPTCPDCGSFVIDDDDNPLTTEELVSDRRKRTCVSPREDDPNTPCGAPLWQAGRGSMKRSRIGLAEYAKKKMRGFFDLLIADEVHEYKARDTAQGQAAATWANVCGKTLTLTGTFMGGYSSTLFHLLYRFYPEFRERFPHNGESKWIDQYGFVERTTRNFEKDVLQGHGTGSNRRITHKTTRKEVPGLMPQALFHLIENTVFVRLSDVSDDLPTYQEYVIVNELDDEPGRTGLSQKRAYEMLERTLERALKAALGAGSQRLLGTYVQSLLSYPDGATRGERVIDPRENEVLIELPPLDRDRTYPKEMELIDLVNREKARGRNVLVYVTHTDTRDITGRLKDILEREGNKVAVLKASTPKPSSREAWIENQVAQGTNVLICNPKLVQTGLDLIAFPTLVWFETEYSVYTMRQASRRSWRIGQKEPVEVYYMTYADTIQSKALRLIAAKIQSSLAVEGELPEEGLSAYGDTQDNLIVTLARQVAGYVRDEIDETQALQEEFARARIHQEQYENLLVDDEWKIPEHWGEPDPEGPDPAPEHHGAEQAGPEAGGPEAGRPEAPEGQEEAPQVRSEPVQIAQEGVPEAQEGTPEPVGWAKPRNARTSRARQQAAAKKSQMQMFSLDDFLK